MDERIRARRMQVRAAHARRRRRWIASGIAVVLLAVAAAAVARSPLFAVTEVRLTGVNAEQAEELGMFTPVRRGENLLALDIGSIERRLERLPWVRSVDAVRVPPSTLEVRVDVREPVAVVRLEGTVWLVDATGVVLGPGAKRGLIEIDAPRSVLPGVGEQASDAAVRNALAVHAALPPHWREAVDHYDAPSERGLRLHLVLDQGAEAAEGSGEPESQASGIWVRFGAAERAEDKAQVLDALLEQVRKAPVVIAEIDVRAPDNPVLVPA